MLKNYSNITGVLCILVLFFFVINCSNVSGGYTVKEGKVYYNDARGGMLPFGSDKLIEGADAETFEIFNKHFGKDKNRVYFEGEEVTKIAVKTFQFINDVYSKDESNVYYKKSVLTDKPQTFKVLFLDCCYPNNISFSTDGTKIFSKGEPFFPNKVDLATFERVGKTGYVRDKNRVYNSKKEIDADPKTFQVLNHSSYGNRYARDKSSIFYDELKVEKADVKTHKIIDDYYHKDANHVFKANSIVSDDPDSFQIPTQ